MPLTTFEVYDVENSTNENVTFEFVDLSTTEAISSTPSLLQYLETASYKQGTYIYIDFLFAFQTHTHTCESRQFKVMQQIWEKNIISTFYATDMHFSLQRTNVIRFLNAC